MSKRKPYRMLTHVMLQRPPEITEKKLRAFFKGDTVGLCYPDGRIEIDPRQKPADWLDTLLHEMLHREFPFLAENEVVRAANNMARSMWELRFRRMLAE